jgi:putative CocE/NonD family hydrolase
VSHLMADTKWALTRAYLAALKHLALPFKELPSVTAERFPGVRVRRGAMVEMRDGVRLCTDVYLPADRTGAVAGEPRPALLVRMPYGIREAYAYMPAVGRFWARRGYAAVVQDVRGKFGSEGEWRPFEHEIEDGYDTIDWVARQPWCDGRVAMSGESYYAYTQWAAAASGHPALVSIAPGDMGLDMHTLLYEGGALCLSTTALWLCDQAGHGYLNWYRFNSRHLPVRDIAEAGGLPGALFQGAADHPARDELWEAFDYRYLLDKVEVPTLVWSGWYDNLLGGTLQVWAELEARRPDLAGRRRLLLGPTDHETSCDFDGKVGRIRIPEGPRTWDEVLKFTDAVLAGEPTGPRVSAYVTGAGRRHHGDCWPPEDTGRLRLHLRAAGALTQALPEYGEEPAEFAYDPADPAAYWEGKDLWAMTTALSDRRPLHARPDVLLYRGDPLPADVDVLGEVTALISVSTAATDADVTVALVDIAPGGHTQLVREGIRRLSHRDPGKAPQPAEPGTLYRAAVGLGGTGHRFPAGHRIGIEISGSSFDRWDRNPQPGRTTIHHRPGEPSLVDLPVIGGLR